MDAAQQAALQAIAEREQAEANGPQVGPTAEGQAALDALKPEPTTEPEPKKRESVYAVFRVSGDEDTALSRLSLVEGGGKVTGANDKAAILAVVNPNEVPGGLGYYVAIAHRSLSVRKVGVVTEPRVVVE